MKGKNINRKLSRTREASEPLFEEQSDAVKVSETLCLWLKCQPIG